MLAEGLVDVDTIVHARSWQGGTAGALLIAANIAQARDAFLDAGMSAAQLDDSTSDAGSAAGGPRHRSPTPPSAAGRAD